jgi:hypothetical protein
MLDASLSCAGKDKKREKEEKEAKKVADRQEGKKSTKGEGL